MTNLKRLKITLVICIIILLARSSLSVIYLTENANVGLRVDAVREESIRAVDALREDVVSYSEIKVRTIESRIFTLESRIKQVEREIELLKQEQ